VVLSWKIVIPKAIDEIASAMTWGGSNQSEVGRHIIYLIE
jgi:hypothetical protein